MATLLDLARAAGIDAEYVGDTGKPVSSRTEAICAVLDELGPGLGFDLGDCGAAAIDEAAAAFSAARWARALPEVVLGWDGELVLPFAVPADHDAEWAVEIATEGGRRVVARGRLFELPAADHAWPGGRVHCLRRARVAVGELGYHTIAWTCGAARGESFAIAAPMQGFGAPGTDRRRWGVFAPVYGLATTTSGDAGDLASLRQLMAAVARRGGRYVATLPLLATFLDEPCQISPYSPASRLAWNEVYLDMAQLADEAGLPPVTAPPRSGGPIEFRAHYKWRRAALDAYAAAILSDPARAAAIDAWSDGGITYDYAAFRAIGERERTSWPQWPAALREGVPIIGSRADAAAAGLDVARVGSHVVGQWAMQRQLGALSAGSVGLYLDLPVGVNRDAYEVWRHRELFLLGLSAGAPPDALFLGGQDWGLPPLSPSALRRDRYRYFIACVRHHMKVAGMLRIDHVMGLFRLYCVPVGMPATAGVYVRYPADELIAVLTLESMRARCALAGEDLGTVPDQVRPAMTHHGMYRLHVGQWALPQKLGDRTERAPVNSVASLNTHDMSTFAGWWLGGDIDDRRALGLTTAAQEAEERVARARAEAALIAQLPASPVPDASELARAMIAVTAELAAGPAEVMLVALDDLALEPGPHNVPGTMTERPNWQRRVPGWSTALDPDPVVAGPIAAAAIAAVVAARDP